MSKKKAYKLVSVDEKKGTLTLSDSGVEKILENHGLTADSLSNLSRMLKSGVITIVLHSKSERAVQIEHDKGGVKYNILK